MDSTDNRNNGTLQTVYEDDEDFNCSSAEPPTVETTPRVTQGPGPYQREIERLTRQLIEREQQVKLQEELLLQYATPVKPSVTDPTLTPRVPRPQDNGLHRQDIYHPIRIAYSVLLWCVVLKYYVL